MSNAIIWTVGAVVWAFNVSLFHNMLSKLMFLVFAMTAAYYWLEELE